ncbi:MAG: hypothetical protein C5B51_17245 [Terriglobia bacterium]|nr:MAG: hypothetical protein C5B51_17245 [Terriglobia bacterium]
MDVRSYYQKIRENESTIAEPFAIVVSVETANGGKPGTLSEVTRAVAAKMLVDGIVRRASEEEAAAFRAQQAEDFRHAEQQLAAAQVQLSIVPTSELNELKAAVRTRQE